LAYKLHNVESVTAWRKQVANRALGSVIAEIESMSADLDLYTVRRILRDAEESIEREHEILAFSFISNRDNGNARYFGPFYSNGDHEWPSDSDITNDVFDYWSDRLKSSQNKFMMARYAGILWQYSRIRGENNIHFAHQWIRNVLESINSKLYKYMHDARSELEYISDLVQRFQHPELKDLVATTIINFASIFNATDEKIGIWVGSLIQAVAKKSILKQNQAESLILDGESRINRLIQAAKNGNEGAAHSSMQIFSVLAPYYRRTKQFDKISDYARKILECLYVIEQRSSLVFQIVLNNYYDFCVKFDTLKEFSLEIVSIIDVLGKDVLSEMKVFRFEVPGLNEENYLEEMLSGEPIEIISRFIHTNIPSIDFIKKNVERAKEASPLSSLLPRTLIDNSGRIISSSDDDMTDQLRLWEAFNSKYRRLVLCELIKGGIVPGIFERMKNSVFFNETDHALKSGLEAYEQGNAVLALHLLIPQIEKAIRCIADRSGAIVIKQNRERGFDSKSLGLLLALDEIKNAIGEDGVAYFKFSLSDRKGLNLRNKICHGLCTNDDYTAENADLIFLILMRLSFVQESTS